MISLLTPTRHRPAGLMRMYDSAMSTAADPENVEVVAVTDPDDLTYLGITPPRLRFVVAPEHTVMSDLWNVAWRNAIGPIYGLSSDDVVYKTPGWDEIVTHAFPLDGIAHVFGDDGARVRDENGATKAFRDFGCLGFIRKEWTDITGEFTQGIFSADWADATLNDIARALGRNIEVDILTDHLHPMWGTAPSDEVYYLKWARDSHDNNEKRYQDSADVRAEQVAALAAACL